MAVRLAALYPDVWIALALAASRTETIGLGTGVLVPRLRHVLTTAAAAANIEHLAPGRLAVGVGTGFTGSRALGQKAMKWADVEAYVTALRALLRGETVEWEGAAIRLMHPEGVSAPLPIEVPIVIAAEGPEGHRRRPAAGRRAVRHRAAAQRLRLGHQARLGNRPRGWRGPAVGPGLRGRRARRRDALPRPSRHPRHRAVAEQLPNGAAWAERVRQIPETERHLAIHADHLVKLSDLDRDVLPREVIPNVTLTGTAAEVRAKVEELAADGVTELAYQPHGPDIPRELEAFIEGRPARRSDAGGLAVARRPRPSRSPVAGATRTDEPTAAPPVSATAETAGDSKDLRAFLRRRGRQDGAAWAGSIDRRGTVFRRGGEEVVVTVLGVPEERDLEEVCAAAKDYRTGPVIVKVSNSDGSLATEC